MNTRFLRDEEKAQVTTIMGAFGIEGFDASVRLWGRGKAIEVSGPLDKRQLSCLLAIAAYLNDSDTAAADDAAHPMHAPANTSIRVEAQF